MGIKRIHKVLILIAIYLLCLGIRIYWLSQKEGLHVDEGASIVLANYNEYMWTKNYDFNVEYTGKELKEMSLCSDNSIRDLFYDIYRLWIDTRDYPHTNLYYSFLRLSLAGLKTGELKPIIIRGGILNLFFFTISFIFFFFIMKQLFPESILLQITATTCAFLSTATISNTLFLRPYQIQETMFIIFCFYFIKTLDSQKYIIQNTNIKKELYINVRQLLFLSFITGVTLLTGYYSILYIGLFGIYIVYNNFKSKNCSEIIFYIIVLILGLLIAQTFYSKYLNGFILLSPWAKDVAFTTNIPDNIVLTILEMLSLFNRHFLSYPVIIICIISIIFLLFKKRLNSKKVALFIFFISLIFIFISLLTVPFITLRYIMPVFPFLIILPAIVINTLYIKNKIVAYISMLLLSVVYFVNSLNQDNIEHIYRGKQNQYTFTYNKNIPVVIFNEGLGKYTSLIPYLNNEQIYYFIKNHDDVYLCCPYNEFYYIYESNKDIEIDVEYFNMEESFKIITMEPKSFNRTSGRFVRDSYFNGLKLSHNAGK